MLSSTTSCLNSDAATARSRLASLGMLKISSSSSSCCGAKRTPAQWRVLLFCTTGSSSGFGFQQIFIINHDIGLQILACHRRSHPNSSLARAIKFSSMASLITLSEPVCTICISSNKLTIGSRKDNDIIVSRPEVSALHCEILRDRENRFYIVDRSQNGTFIYEHRISQGRQVQLKNGDKIFLQNPRVHQNLLGFTFILHHAQPSSQLQWCLICKNYMRDSIVLDCGHNFCPECIRQWEQKCLFCPTCGLPIIEDDDGDEEEEEANQSQIEESCSDYCSEYSQGQSEYELKISQNACLNCIDKWRGYQCQKNSPHSCCTACGRLMPLLFLNELENMMLKLFCQICYHYHCKYYYGDCRDQTQLELARHLGRYLTISDFNEADQKRILRHLNGQPLQAIFDYMLQCFMNQGLFYYTHNRTMVTNPQLEYVRKIYPDSPICWRCSQPFLKQLVIRYVQSKQEEVEFNSPPCRYGINCTEQQDQQHARYFTHLCPSSEK